MKKTILFGALFLACTVFADCSKSVDHWSDYERSRLVWLGFKKFSGNSYEYQVVQGSWVGFSSITNITVTSGKVTQRYFKFIPPPGSPTNIPPGDLEWTENESQLNTHTTLGPAATLTLDQIYDKARTEWLIERRNSTTYFEAKNNGMISSCGYGEVGCQDDCFVGINIAFIHKR